MIQTLFTIALASLLTLCSALIPYQVPISPGVTNSIAFNILKDPESLGSILHSRDTSAENKTNQYTYRFSTLPLWVTSINGSTISGIPPQSPLNYSITVSYRRGEEGQRSQSVMLVSRKNQKGNASSPLPASNFTQAFDYNNIYNPINPKSPYNPFNPSNPKGVRYSGKGGYDQFYYSLNNPNNPNHKTSKFNPSNSQSIYNPNNPESPLYLLNPLSPLNSTSPFYKKQIFSNQSFSINNLLIDPLSPNSIYYPNSPNYIPSFRFDDSSSFSYLTEQTNLTSNYSTRVFFSPPQAVTYTPPPTLGGRNPTPSYIQLTPSSHTSEQIKGLLAQQTMAQNNLANALNALNKAYTILANLQSQAIPLNQILKDASQYLNSSQTSLKKAVSDQSLGRDQTLKFLSFMVQLNTRMIQTKSNTDESSRVLSSLQSQLRQNQAKLGVSQVSIVSTSQSYNQSKLTVLAINQQIGQYKENITHLESMIVQTNRKLQNNTQELAEAKSEQMRVDARVRELQQLLQQAKQLSLLSQYKVNILTNFPSTSKTAINQYQANISIYKSKVSNLQTILPSAVSNQAISLNSLNNAQRSYLNLQTEITNLQKRIPEVRTSISNTQQVMNTLRLIQSKAQENITLIKNNQNILDQNVAVLQKQQSDATEYLKNAQVTADGLKQQLESATLSYTLSQNAYNQARMAKMAADQAVNAIMIGNSTAKTQDNIPTSPSPAITLTQSAVQSIKSLVGNDQIIYPSGTQLVKINGIYDVGDTKLIIGQDLTKPKTPVKISPGNSTLPVYSTALPLQGLIDQLSSSVKV